jgi:hypothetical protein
VIIECIPGSQKNAGPDDDVFGYFVTRPTGHSCKEVKGQRACVSGIRRH